MARKKKDTPEAPESQDAEVNGEGPQRPHPLFITALPGQQAHECAVMGEPCVGYENGVLVVLSTDLSKDQALLALRTATRRLENMDFPPAK